MRRRIGIAAVLMLGTLTGIAPNAVAATVTTTRLSGADRFATAAAMAGAKFPNGVSTVILASGLTFADALAGSYYAGVGSAGCPKSAILLTLSDTLPPATQKALADLHAQSVTILGGTAAVSDAVAGQIRGLGLTVNRIGGIDRFDTMRLLDTACGPPGQKLAIIASGLNFPDALSAGGAAYGLHLPMILTLPDHLSAEAQQVLSTLGIMRVLVMGGASAVSPGVNSAITAMNITIVKQFAGVDRTDTAAQFATWSETNLGFSSTSIAIARGDDFADALAGAQVTGDPENTLLTLEPNNLGAKTTAYLEAGRITELLLMGGPSAITPDAANAATTAAAHQCCAIASVAPSTFKMPGTGGQAFTLTGGFPAGPQVQFLVSADNPNPPTGSCARNTGYAATLNASSTPTQLNGAIQLPTGCPPGHYDVGVVGQNTTAFAARNNDAVVITSAALAVSPLSVPADNALHTVKLFGRGFVDTATVFLSPSVDNHNAPKPNCGSSTNEINVSDRPSFAWDEITFDVTLPPTCPQGKWDVNVDESSTGAGIAGCLDCLTVGAAAPPAQRTMTISPTQPVRGNDVVVTYDGGIENPSDAIGLRSPSGFTYHCTSGGTDTTIHASGQCDVVFPSGDPTGTYVLAWTFTGDTRGAPCASDLSYKQAMNGNPAECDLSIPISS